MGTAGSLGCSRESDSGQTDRAPQRDLYVPHAGGGQRRLVTAVVVGAVGGGDVDGCRAAVDRDLHGTLARGGHLDGTGTGREVAAAEEEFVLGGGGGDGVAVRLRAVDDLGAELLVVVGRFESVVQDGAGSGRFAVDRDDGGEPDVRGGGSGPDFVRPGSTVQRPCATSQWPSSVTGTANSMRCPASGARCRRRWPTS